MRNRNILQESMFRGLFKKPVVERTSRLVDHTRNYAVRTERDSPFLYLPNRKSKKPFINWKMTGIFAVIGSYLSYSELVLDSYAELTASNEDNDMLPVQLRYRLTQLPIYQKINHSTESQDWTKLETWEDLDHNILDKQDFGHIYKGETHDEAKVSDKPAILSHTLAKPGGFLIKPIIFHNKRTGEGVSIVHAGYRLCGYPFIVHGGILATILNETFKRNAALSRQTSSNYKGDFKVENLSISYKFPSFANQFLIVKTEKVPFEGEHDKLVKLQSTVESEKGRVLVQSEAILHDTGLVTNSKKTKLLTVLSYVGI